MLPETSVLVFQGCWQLSSMAMKPMSDLCWVCQKNSMALFVVRHNEKVLFCRLQVREQVQFHSPRTRLVASVPNNAFHILAAVSTRKIDIVVRLE